MTVEDFSTQFSPLYLPIKYLAIIISRHPVYIGKKFMAFFPLDGIKCSAVSNY